MHKSVERAQSGKIGMVHNPVDLRVVLDNRNPQASLSKCGPSFVIPANDCNLVEWECRQKLVIWSNVRTPGERS